MNLKSTIIHESLKLFSLNGFSSTSMQDIISAAKTSKGGFYNHFSSKEDLFFQVLDEGRQIWREKNLYGIDEVKEPLDKIQKLLENYKNRYLIDTENFPGGCLFIMFAVELGDSHPHLSREVQKGFSGLKAMLKRLLDNGYPSTAAYNGISTDTVTEIIFNGMLGASVSYSLDKSYGALDTSINALIDYLDKLKKNQKQEED
ncbi:MAG: TetR/AcrR family transcriptional regulator [Desulfobacterales bacterium]|nr:TetR/AcrR family transcriptional regulator [Desulfobacterales bacterium]MDX2513042.1 TetR/AcrR family transcriptional regulator [Desulfobacterales bacterium]